MAITDSRNNDTPIGGTEEFRGNMQSGDVYGVDDVPVWDGEKFAPGTNSALLNAYGGLANSVGGPITADGTPMDDWDVITPLGGTPLQTTPNIVTGEILVAQSGVYDVTFSLDGLNFDNNIAYFFQLAADGVGLSFGGAITGSNQVTSQSISFELLSSIAAGVSVSVIVTAPASQTFDVLNSKIGRASCRERV